ncbi:large membrane protein [Babesia ovata]|uniref:Large membrane protein n=1 Tax=Babesia ovata TaxID=189622 RepID=A0A2H6KF02_9APIC|nr:large membrane protein [Babesia ovata]GBE61571.1 large membrane protein [Babesia ovata]
MASCNAQCNAISRFFTSAIYAAREFFDSPAFMGLESLAGQAVDGVITKDNIKTALKTPSVDEVMDGVVKAIMWYIWVSYVIPLILILGFISALLLAAYVYGWGARCSSGFLKCTTVIVEMTMYGFWKLKKWLYAFLDTYSEYDDYGLLSKFRGHRYLPAAYAKCKLR